MRTSLSIAACLFLLAACDGPPAENTPKQASSSAPEAAIPPVDERLRGMMNAIDAAIEAFYARQGKPLPPEASDEVFLRRVYLGITGQIPSAQEVSQFLADGSPHKRGVLIDRLLDSPEAADHLFLCFAEMLHLRDEALGASQQVFLDWMKTSLRKNMRYDDLVRAMITAEGSLEENPAGGWLLAAEGSTIPATMDLCNVWLGYNLQCASCHDSPYSDATQMQLYQIAAHFGAVRTVQRTPDGGEHAVGAALPLQPSATLAMREDRTLRLRLPRDYKYKDGNSGDPVFPRLPRLNLNVRGAIWQPPTSPLHGRAELPAPTSLRESLALWVTMENEVRFSHMIAGRLWTEMVGQGDSFQRDSRDLREPLAVGSLNAMVPLIDLGYSPGYWGWRCHAGPLSYEAMQAAGNRAFSIEIEELGHPVRSTLASVMRDVGYDLREFQRVMWNTRAAQREATPDASGVINESKYATLADAPASPQMRRMRAEQIWDALVSLAGANTPEKPSRALPQVLPDTHPLRELGRSARGWSDGDRAPLSPTIVRWMMHSPLVQSVASPGSRVMKEMEHAGGPDARIRQAFLAILSRNPSSKEMNRARELYGDTEMDTPSVDGFLVWTLVNTSEFLFLH